MTTSSGQETRRIGIGCRIPLPLLFGQHKNGWIVSFLLRGFFVYIRHTYQKVKEGKGRKFFCQTVLTLCGLLSQKTDIFSPYVHSLFFSDWVFCNSLCQFTRDCSPYHNFLVFVRMCFQICRYFSAHEVHRVVLN